MNCHWWKLRSEIQGLKPPSMRNNTQFDAGAKYHVAGDVGYVRYFTAFIYEFQFYRELCLASGRNHDTKITPVFRIDCLKFFKWMNRTD